MGRPTVCPFCGSTRSISKGRRKTKTMGERRIRLCRDCRRKYTPKHQKPPEPEPEPPPLEGTSTGPAEEESSGASDPLAPRAPHTPGDDDQSRSFTRAATADAPDVVHPGAPRGAESEDEQRP